MSQEHVFSVKVGASHGLWQYKRRGTHDRVILNSLRHILDGTCRLLGFDRSDRSFVYRFVFSSEPFDGYQVCVQKLRETREGCTYEVMQSAIGELVAQGRFPAFVNVDYFHAWPQRIYFKIEKSLTGGIES